MSELGNDATNACIAARKARTKADSAVDAYVAELEAQLATALANRLDACHAARMGAFDEAAGYASRHASTVWDADELSIGIRALASTPPEPAQDPRNYNPVCGEYQCSSCVAEGTSPERRWTLAEIDAAAHKAMDGSGGEPVYPWMDRFRAALTGAK